MKFKPLKNDTYKRLDIPNKDGETLRIETKEVGNGVFIEILDADGYTTAITDLSKNKAIKLAYAILEELSPTGF